MSRLNWKRSKLNDSEWIEAIASCAVGGEYRIRGTRNEFVVGYHRPRERRGSYVKIGTAANVPEAMAQAQADNDKRTAAAEAT
jgi:hypothetical protein